jgi:hypothetical protein
MTLIPRSARRSIAFLAAIALCATALLPESTEAKRPRKTKPSTEEATETLKAPPKHPVFGVPVYEGAHEASEKTIRGLGLDAFEGYRVGVFLTNASALEVATFYVRAMARTVKKEQTEETLRYTLMIEPPSADNPLGDKIVVDETEGGVRNEAGERFKTSIAVYRKLPQKTAAKP